ncbi:Eisosome component PIL1-domain-containing protein [Lophiotrema nucula]|uniref:Eisosome component PIL1-domain-containing protein n=1 Tax=Lophiotrema nucula TaxID=690887 RepID=A0A6A5YTG0_9PLEO|nr:Eisosome component PIL1-domain-containing protein [Lophiotrema nucula]
MVLELHVWGPAFGLPSIDAECIAATAYLNCAVPHDEWILIAAYETKISSRGEFPALVDASKVVTGFRNIVSHLRDRDASLYDLDRNLTQQGHKDALAFASFLQSTGTPLLDLYLYVSSENYNHTTTSAYTAILPWYLNYTIPPRRRDLARARTVHLGLSSLDVNTASEDGPRLGAGTASSEFEAAKRAAGLPVSNRAQPQSLNLGRGKGIGGLLSSPIHAARFRLDSLSNELLEPISDLLGTEDYLFGERSSLDCLAFGYLALLLYPPVPQAWLKETVQTRFPRVRSYINRMRKELVGEGGVIAADVWNISSGGSGKTQHNLPWHSRKPRPTLSRVMAAAHEIITHLPVVSAVTQPSIVYQHTDTRLSRREVARSTLPSPLAVKTQSRAPTASQIQNPPPPSSSTKSGRFFGKSNIGHTFRRNAAGAFGPDLAKKLSQLVKMEKNVMRSMELVSKERMEVAQQLSIWGEACDDDVSDVTDKLGVLIYEIAELEDQYIDRYDQYRVTIKSIRNIEASVQPSRDRKQKITDQIAQLKYKEPNSPKIVVLEQELVRAEAESLVAEAQLSNITREKLKAAFTYQFDALREHCEKLAIIAGYGKHLLELVDDTPVTPGETRNAYDGYETSKAIIQDCEDALTNWVQQNAAVSSKLSTRSRTLSQRRRARARQGEGVDLSGQDQALDNRESGLWIPASEHQGNGYEDEEEEEDAPSTIATETRGREEERVVTA